MAQMLVGTINLSKIDKEKLYTSERGEKFLNIVVWLNDTADQYDNIASIQESKTKEERENGIPNKYLGNLRVLPSKQVNTNNQNNSEYKGVKDTDDLPF